MSTIITKDSIVGESYQINHNFGEGFTLKIISIDTGQVEKVIFEMKAAAGNYVNLKATITDKEILSP